MSAPVAFALRSGRWLLIRHLLTTTVTILVVMAAWAVASAPIVAVFALDDAFSASEYAGAALVVAGSVCVATLAVAPLAVGLERLVLRGGRARTAMAVLLPIALFVAIAACVLAMVKLVESHAAYLAFALAAFLMFLLAIYWPTLWMLNVASWVLRRLRHAQRIRRFDERGSGT
ncbi:hypothetical protein [Couchioplanes caeruleus]|uniref:Uncharacterized protein n=1 Tax=Couchioplanes caeruleus subsp. caeruleus TaxID=56427 RepID=A0A1K0H2H6_9ACTN|nr:hypothetical protein [Couchioplanes caeruleus]OJF15907.1 hypothetical protein BG844_01325 [Couchioplanes caeruleus subsp. caeruleus]